MMRKLLCFLTGLVLCVSLMTGCAVNDVPDEESDSTAEVSGTSGNDTDSLTIASTSAAICEILEALEYYNVIGVPETSSTLPECFQGVTTIGAPMTPDTEILCQLDPDLVLSPKTLESSLAAEYTQAGLDAAFLDLSSVEGMYDAINSLGALLGREEQAAALQAEYEEYMSDYYQDKADGPDVLLLMCFPDGFYLVASEVSYVGNLVSLAGGKNVYADYEGTQEGFISINPEDMVQKDPDMILVFAHYNEEAAFEYMENEFATNTAWSYYEAVNEGNIVYLPSEYFGMSASLDWTDALEYLEPYLYEE